MDIRRALWLRRLDIPGAEAFATLFALEALTRALVVPILPIAALQFMGDAAGVSLLFFGVGLCGLVGTLVVPALVRLLARRWVYTIGGLTMAAAAVSMCGDTQYHLAAGMVLRVLGVIMTTVCLSLYIMDHIARTEFSRSEPLRLMFGGAAWMIGPALGAWLAQRFDPDVTFAVSGIAALTLLAYFWRLRIRDVSPLTRFAGKSPNPLQYVRQFAARPRLTFAWTIALGRYIWWVMFFVYAPLFAVQAGLGQMVAGLLISAGSSFMLLLPLFGKVVRRFGMRAVLVVGFTVSSIFCVSMAILADLPWVAIACLGVATMGMVSLDAVANMPFMLAVRRHERPEMTAVYSTYRDVGEVLAPGFFALVLKFLPLAGVFAATGGLMAGLAWLSRKVHPRLGIADRPQRQTRTRAEDAPASA